MALPQQLRHRRLRRRLELAERDPVSRPARPLCGRRRDQSGVRIEAAKRIGLPAFGRAGVEDEIVKVPEHEIVVTLLRAQAIAGYGIERQQDLAIGEQGEKLEPGETALALQL